MIRFPRMHIAESVVNRIMNLRDDLEPMPEFRTAGNDPRSSLAQGHAMPQELDQPHVPDTLMQGAELDMALSEPVPPVAGEVDPLAASVAQGADLIDGF